MTSSDVPRFLPWILALLAASPSSAEDSLCLKRLIEGGAPFAALAAELASDVADGRFSEEGGRRLLGLARHNGDLGAEACAYAQLGNAAFFRGDSQGAVRAFEAALERLVTLGDLEGQAYRLKDIGVCLRTQGRFAEALQAFEDARRIYPAAIEGPFAVSFLGNLGSLYARLGASRLAADTFREALEYAEADPSAAAATWDLQIRLALLLLEGGSNHHAASLLEKSVQNVERRGADRDLSWVLGELGWAYEKTGRFDEARRVLERSLRAARRSEDRLHVVGALIDLGDLLLRTAKDASASDGLDAPEDLWDAAERAFQEAVDTDGSQPLTWRAYAGLGKVQRHKGRVEQAIEFFETSLELSEQRRRGLSSWQDRSRLAAWSRPVYSALAAVLIEVGEPERAFAVAELGKARDLAAELDAAGISQPSPRAKHPRRAAIEARIAALVAEIQADPDGPEGRFRDLEAAEAELDQILDASRDSGSDAPLALEQIRGLLPPGTTLLSYLSSNEDVVVFAVGRDALIARRLELRGDRMRLAIEVYLEQLVASRHWHKASGSLHRVLVKPVADALEDTDHLIIAADGPLRALPFSTLVASGEGSELEDFLLSRFTISMVPSARVLGDLRDRRPRAEHGLLALADPIVDRGFALYRLQAELYGVDGMSPLPESRREAETAAAFARPSKLLLGEHATEAELRSERLGEFQILHVATHALLDSRMPRRSALVLTPTVEDDGFLQAREIARLRACPELVVLAACRSGRGEGPPGRVSGVHGLALSFFHAGARSVVGTLWPVDDAVSHEVMAGFYRQLAAGHGRAAALRRAQVEAFERYGAGSPMHWAPWVLMGEPFDGVQLQSPPAGKAQGRGVASVVLPALLFAAGLLSGGLWLVLRFSDD